MRLGRLFRTSAFRYALVYAALFSLALGGALGFVYWRTAAVIAAQIDDTIEAEIRGLADQYRDGGLAGLTRTIARRAEDNPGLRNVYLLTGPAYRPIAGNLDAWPRRALGEPRWIEFTIRGRLPTLADEALEERRARARTFVLPGDLHLLVGRDTTELAAFRELTAETSIGALAAGTVLALGIGLLTSGAILRRVEGIGREARGILAGDLGRRMPVKGTGDEFDRLAEQLNAMLDRIEELMESLRSVADDIAHDLRTPISRLRSRVEVALMEQDDPVGLRRTLEETIGEADAILSTFNALLGIALAESGARQADFETVDLSTVAADAADLYGPVAEEAGVALATDLRPGTIVRGEAALLAQAAANLLDNAVKYTAESPGNKEIRLMVEAQPDGGARLTVADTGPGIPLGDRARVLRRFVRLEASRHAAGSGLGLALVSAVAKAHGAVLLLDGTPEGGLTVSLRFPPPDGPGY